MPSHRFENFTPISSGHLDGARYNSTDRRLTVRFKNGYQYEVSGVSPEDYQAFIEAPSQGEHYHQVLKPNFHVERTR